MTLVNKELKLSRHGFRKGELCPPPTKGEGDMLFFVQILLVLASLLVCQLLVCKISRELVSRLEPNLHGYKIDT